MLPIVFFRLLFLLDLLFKCLWVITDNVGA
ncbi:hypothetical protein AAKU67_001155 [Oxalobacteraceae bacterium GrIS 2.11]